MTYALNPSQAVFDPVLDDISELNSDRFVLGDKPDNEQAWAMYKKQQASLWTSEEISLSEDRLKFQALPDGEKAFIKNVLAFFASADGIVSEHIVTNMQSRCKQKSVQAFYAVQTYIEKVHQETYNDLVLNLVLEKEEQTRMFQAIDNDEGIRAKTEWAIRWMNSPIATFAEKLVAFACVEGMMFSSSFCSIYYLKSRGRELPGLFVSNHFIQKDEALHTQFACMLHNQLQPANKCPPSRIKEIIMDAVEAERVFVHASLKLDLINMNPLMMMLYVEFVANTVLALLGCEKAYPKSLNPFPFMDTICLNSKTNFFEDVEPNYNNANVGVAVEDRAIRMDADF